MALAFPIALLFVVFLLVYFARKNRALLEQLASEIGATEARSKWFPPATHAIWRGRGITLRIGKQGKYGPYFAVVDISAASPARVIVQQSSWLNAVSFFGPPRVEIAGAANFIVRSDDIMLAQKIFSDAALSMLMARTIVENVDLLELKSDRVRVRRVAMSGSGENKLEAAREAWPLAAAVVESLGLPPAG
jgi:hypothetical protein